MDFGELLIYVTSFFGIFTSVYFLTIITLGRKKLFKGEVTTCRPVTVCVPCFNEEKTVIKTLQSLCDLDYDKKQLEIMVMKLAGIIQGINFKHGPTSHFLKGGVIRE